MKKNFIQLYSYPCLKYNVEILNLKKLEIIKNGDGDGN